MRFLVILSLLLTGCASSPYMEYKFAWQHDRGSDWVLQPEREWVKDGQKTRFHVEAGLEWDNQTSLYVESLVVGPWRWSAVSVSKQFGASDGDGWYIKPSLVHQVDSKTSDFLHTDDHRWSGHNPFIHLRIGYQYHWFRCPVIATGFSVEPMVKGKHFFNNPGHDIYWTNVECGVRVGGKTGMWK